MSIVGTAFFAQLWSGCGVNYAIFILALVIFVIFHWSNCFIDDVLKLQILSNDKSAKLDWIGVSTCNIQECLSFELEIKASGPIQ